VKPLVIKGNCFIDRISFQNNRLLRFEVSKTKLREKGRVFEVHKIIFEIPNGSNDFLAPPTGKKSGFQSCARNQNIRYGKEIVFASGAAQYGK